MNRHETGALLIRQGVIKGRSRSLSVDMLPGGAVNRVYVVATPQGRVVLKEVVERVDRKSGVRLSAERAAAEYKALQFLASHLPGSFSKPLFFERATGVIGMEAVLGDVRLLEHDLLSGSIDAAIAGAIGRICGNLHSESAKHPEFLRAFGNEDTLRFKIERQCLDVEVSPLLDEHIRGFIDELTGRRMALLHGDLCPKNIFVSKDKIVLFDLEEAHFGNPLLEIGYVLAHYWLIAMVSSSMRECLVAATRSFWMQYKQHCRPILDPPAEREINTMAGIFMLSRVDGVARPDWLTGHSRCQIVRSRAIELLESPPSTILGALDLLVR